MAEADSKTITPTRQRVTLADYAQRKTDETGDRDSAHGLIVMELGKESEGRLPYHYKRADDIDGRDHDEGLPVGYLWRDATINWSTSSARWSERIAPGLGFLRELRIYRIKVAVPAETAAEAEPVAAAPADELIPELGHAAMRGADKADALPETAAHDAPAEPQVGGQKARKASRIKSKDWLVNYVKQRADAGDIPPTITEFSIECETEMAQDDRVRSLDRRSIENLLRDLRLWPIPTH